MDRDVAGSRETSWEGTVITPEGVSVVLDQSGGHGGGEMEKDLGHIWKVDLIERGDRWDVGCERISESRMTQGLLAQALEMQSSY